MNARFPPTSQAGLLGTQVDRFALHADGAGPERRHIENDHDESEKIHSHRQPNSSMHRTNADQPNFTCLVIPNKKWISNFQHTNKYSCDREQVFPFHQCVWINDVEWATDARAPHARTTPATTAQTSR